MDISLQTRLLRVLETGQFMKIGSTTLKHVDVRVIAATNRDMEILEKIYFIVYLLSISIFLHYGNGGKIFLCL